MVEPVNHPPSSFSRRFRSCSARCHSGAVTRSVGRILQLDNISDESSICRRNVHDRVLFLFWICVSAFFSPSRYSFGLSCSWQIHFSDMDHSTRTSHQNQYHPLVHIHFLVLHRHRGLAEDRIKPANHCHVDDSLALHDFVHLAPISSPSR